VVRLLVELAGLVLPPPTATPVMGTEDADNVLTEANPGPDVAKLALDILMKTATLKLF
jgi:hypothetical protein